MASTKREAPSNDEPQNAAKKTKVDDGVVSSPSSRSESSPKHHVVINPADCALDFIIGGNGLQGSALHEQGFAYCWSGARADVGINGGKYCFGCKIVSLQSVDMDDTAPDQQNLCRIGISRGDDAVGSLGETSFSFGYGGTGKFSYDGKFSDYGEKFGLGDTIVCAVDLEDTSFASVGFFKNGKWLGRATYFDDVYMGLDSEGRKVGARTAVFPHVLLKNVVVELHFSVEDGLVAEEGFKPWACALEDGNAVMGPVFSDPRDCEVIMMVGLPASGKTTWAEKWVKEHPEKRYVLLGTNLVLDQMKVPGLLRKNNYGERFDRLMNRATEIFNILLSRAATTPRNYIIDQTNVYKSARKRKLKPFALFRKIAVVVFPSPEELKVRSKKRLEEMGKEVPADAVNDMLANFVLPVSKDMRGSDELFDQVMFEECNREESQKYLDAMKRSLANRSYLNPNISLPYSRGSSVPKFSPNYDESPGPYPIPSPVPMPGLLYHNPSYVRGPGLPYHNPSPPAPVPSYPNPSPVPPYHNPSPVPVPVPPYHNPSPVPWADPYQSYGPGTGNAPGHYGGTGFPRAPSLLPPAYPGSYQIPAPPGGYARPGPWYN